MFCILCAEITNNVERENIGGASGRPNDGAPGGVIKIYRIKIAG